jgi:hypothetical protein
MGKYQLGVDLKDAEIGRIVRFLNALTGVYTATPGEGDGK